jgi:5-(carboxyamino)imidazole ribonucleotide synthase
MPNAKVAMIGAGQLARMTHQAAVDFDIELRVLAASADDSAVLGGAGYVLGTPDRLADLEAVASGVDVVTFDHELVSPSNLATMQERKYNLQPHPSALYLAQDKLEARRSLSSRGFPCPAFSAPRSAGEVADFAERYGWPVVLKARYGGYDGRGVRVVDSTCRLDGISWLPDTLPGTGSPGGNTEKDAGGNAKAEARADAKEPAYIVEEYIDISAELSVIVARSPSGEVAVYPPIQTTQSEGICRYLVMPAPVSDPVSKEARGLAESIIIDIDATGIVAVEMFLTGSGQLLVNELALRPHNSGHATIEACFTSQFHQHLRAVLDWPLGSTGMRVPAAAMVNLIGSEDYTDLASWSRAALAVPDVNIHLYGKGVKPGRKLGHITATAGSVDEALQNALATAQLQQIDLTGRERAYRSYRRPSGQPSMDVRRDGAATGLALSP